MVRQSWQASEMSLKVQSESVVRLNTQIENLSEELRQVLAMFIVGLSGLKSATHCRHGNSKICGGQEQRKFGSRWKGWVLVLLACQNINRRLAACRRH